MDFFESTKAVFQRIEKLEPQNVSKIIGYLLLKDQPELEMIRLAFCPDHTLQILIEKVKLELDLSPKPTISPPFSVPLLVSNLPTMFTLFTPPPPLPPLPQNGLWIPQFGPSNFDSSYYYQMLDFRPLDVPPRPPEMQVCNSFRQGYCKYGGSCRFLHVFQMQNGDCMVLNPPPTDEVMSSGSLKQLEIELVELLRSTRGIPVSVSSLPILYFDRYRKVLQVEGYQMENHRQGRFSSRMIKLVARMTTTSIRLTNRPHRRQSIILEEDMNRYAKFRVENGHELQVYLTFPPESTFSEQDVHNYFNNFGPVQEVRIPSQVQRMFGFVTFAYPETAALVLMKTNPHYICGSQVLVKPYRFKPYRENEDRVHDQINYHQDFVDAESKLIPTSRLVDDTDLLGKRQTEDHGQAVELEASDAEGVPGYYFTSEVKNERAETCKTNVER